MAEQAEGAPLLREYRVKSSIEGSNPSLTAILVYTLHNLNGFNRLNKLTIQYTHP